MSNFFVSIPDDETNVSISFADDCEPLATNSSISSNPVSAGEPHSLTLKFGPLSGTQYSSESSTIDISSIIGCVITLEINNSWLGSTSLPSGSYILSTKQLNPPFTYSGINFCLNSSNLKFLNVTSSVSQLAINLLLPSPK